MALCLWFLSLHPPTCYPTFQCCFLLPRIQLMATSTATVTDLYNNLIFLSSFIFVPPIPFLTLPLCLVITSSRTYHCKSSPILCFTSNSQKQRETTNTKRSNRRPVPSSGQQYALWFHFGFRLPSRHVAYVAYVPVAQYDVV